MSSTIGERIKAVRGKTRQDVFAKSLNIHKSSLSRYERGEGGPDIEFASLLCAKYEISPEWLLFGTGPMRRQELRGALGHEYHGECHGAGQSGSTPVEPSVAGPPPASPSALAADVERIVAVLERIGTPEHEIRRAVMEVIRAHQPASAGDERNTQWLLAKEPPNGYGRDPDNDKDR